MVPSTEVVVNDPEIIHADMSKLGASCYLTDRPNARRRRLQSLVNFDIAAIGHLNAGQFQANVLCVGEPPRRNQQMSARESLLFSALLNDNGYRIAGSS